MRQHSRRDLLKAGGILAGAAATAGLLVEPARAFTTTASGLAVPKASAWDQVPVILGRIKPPTFPNQNFDITAYGAKGDGKTDCTTAFAKAVAACTKAGGGHVVVPAGGSYYHQPSGWN